MYKESAITGIGTAQSTMAGNVKLSQGVSIDVNSDTISKYEGAF